MRDVGAFLLEAIPALGAWAYLLLFLVTLGESIVVAGLFVPGTALLVVMGGLLSYGYFHPLFLLLSSISGAIVGNVIGYELGRWGRVRVERWTRFRTSLARSEAFFLRHKHKSVFLGRFIGPIRPFIPFIAGMFRMPRSQFLLSTVLSGIVWAAWYNGVGYAFGLAWKNALIFSSTTVGVSVLLVLLAGIILHYSRKRRTHGDAQELPVSS